MGGSFTEFHEFERRGWSDPDVAAAYEEGFGGLTSQTTEPLLDAAGVGPGTRVLDVACGPGFVTAAAASRGGAAIGVDFSPSQLEIASRLHRGVEFRHGDAAALPFPDASTDAVVSNFGILHFPDPDEFLREAFRVLRPGGRIAFTSWATPDRARGFGMVLAAIAEHGRQDVALPPAPDFFGFSEPEPCERALRAAGFGDPTVTTVPQTWRGPSADAWVDALARGTVRTAALIRAQPPEVLESIRAFVRDAARPYERDGGIEIPMAAVLAAGRRP
jgi:ubiquinone/menaquinone biosynthesis C-methylase UbiE